MGIDIGKPLYLLLLLAVAVMLFLTSKNLGIRARNKKAVIIAARFFTCLFLILALSSLGIVWTVEDTSTVFVLDASDSMAKNINEVEAFVREALKSMKDKDKVAIISFGEEPVMENFLSNEPAFEKISQIQGSKYTNIEKALNAAISALPEGSRKRIVLVTDGEENEGNSNNIAGIIKDKAIDFKVLKIQREKGDEVAAVSVIAPQTLNLGEEFNITVNIKSNVNTSAKLILFDGNQKAAEESIELTKGENRFVFKDVADVGGFKTYRAVVEALLDTEMRNNEASSFINVLDKPTILVIEDKRGEADEIAKILDGAKMDYKRISADSVPGDLQSLARYKTVILTNVSAENLSDEFLKALEPYVRDLGGGLIAIGGDDSFALGGYFKTSLEKVLPVNMELKGKKAIPDMSIFTVIDKSGSMASESGGITKLDLAKEAAARVLDSLRDNDNIGVLTFDSAQYWVVEPQKPTDREALRSDIGTIMPGGGTSILPALEEAVEKMKEQNSKIKHIILLTDGQAEKTGYDELLEEAKNAGITISTVAAGYDADIQLLKYIAEKADGRFYVTDQYSNIPTIFAKETFMAARAYLNNREFTPRLVNMHPVLGGVIDDGMPGLLGYIASSAKDAARVILESDEGDPILTVWQYGLGKTVAWNSDMKGIWSGNYVNWDKNPVLWNNLINWTIENYSNENLEVSARVQDGYGEITAVQKNSSETIDTKAIITTPTLETIEIDLNPEAPGRYKGSFRIDDIGAYLIKVVQGKSGEVQNAVSTGMSVQYSPEYSIDASSDKLERLVVESGGKYIADASEVFAGPIAPVKGRVDLTSPLLLMALLAFLVDVAVRKIKLPMERLKNFFDWITSRMKKIKVENKSESKPKGKVKDTQQKPEHKPEEKKLPTKDKKESSDEKKKTSTETLNTEALLKRKKR
ncbi:MAG TPA: VWA domain-containing protein [Clostridiales bacterium]|nr:VWA domain-containing protein [Clostridiales bacterium]